MKQDEQKELTPMLKLLLEFGPLLVFFFANARGEQLANLFPALHQFGGAIFIATAAFMVAITISLIVTFLLVKKLAIMPLISGIVVIIFGSLTLYLQDDFFIKIKPTIVNTLFGTILLGGLLFGRSLLGYVFHTVFEMNDEGWRKLTLRWGLFFFFLAALNEFIWRNFPTDIWIDFKVWGIMPITFFFTIMQVPLINRYGSLKDNGSTQK